MMGKENTYLASAYKQLQIISQDEQKRMEYTARLKAQLDYNQMMFEAEERGIKKGHAEKEIENIRNLAQNMQWTIEQAMDALGIAPAEREIYWELLKEQPS